VTKDVQSRGLIWTTLRDYPSNGDEEVDHITNNDCQGHHPLVGDETTKWARQAVAEASGVSSRQSLPMERVREGNLYKEESL
jgi:hypothetical protein